jgi:hypothetical protein
VNQLLDRNVNAMVPSNGAEALQSRLWIAAHWSSRPTEVVDEFALTAGSIN